MRLGDDGISVVDPRKVDPDRTTKELGQCRVVWHLDQLDLQRIAVSTINDSVASNKMATNDGQQREDCVLKGSKICGASVALPVEIYRQTIFGNSHDGTLGRFSGRGARLRAMSTRGSDFPQAL